MMGYSPRRWLSLSDRAGHDNSDASALEEWRVERRGANVSAVGILKNRLTASVQQLDKTRLQDRYLGLDVLPIGDAPAREPIRLGGEVQEMQVVPRAGSPSLEVTISDGTGRAVAVFTGRRRLGGLHPGRGIVFEGVARDQRGRLVLLNPAYTLL